MTKATIRWSMTARWRSRRSPRCWRRRITPGDGRQRREALAQLQVHPLTCCQLDVLLPGLDGLAVRRCGAAPTRGHAAHRAAMARAGSRGEIAGYRAGPMTTW